MKYDNRTIYFDKKGCLIVWVNSKNKKLHILEWEKYNGLKPKGYDIHHIDFDKKNWNIENLQLESKSDHLKIHANWIRKDRVWIKKPCKDCKQFLALNHFYQRKGLTPSNRCIKCSGIYFKEIGKNQKFKDKRKIYMKKYYESNKEKWKN